MVQSLQKATGMSSHVEDPVTEQFLVCIPEQIVFSEEMNQKILALLFGSSKKLETT